MTEKPKDRESKLGCYKCGKTVFTTEDKNQNKKLPVGWTRGSHNYHTTFCYCEKCKPKDEMEQLVGEEKKIEPYYGMKGVRHKAKVMGHNQSRTEILSRLKERSVGVEDIECFVFSGITLLGSLKKTVDEQSKSISQALDREYFIFRRTK